MHRALILSLVIGQEMAIDMSKTWHQAPYNVWKARVENSPDRWRLRTGYPGAVRGTHATRNGHGAYAGLVRCYWQSVRNQERMVLPQALDNEDAIARLPERPRHSIAWHWD